MTTWAETMIASIDWFKQSSDDNTHKAVDEREANVDDEEANWHDGHQRKNDYVCQMGCWK